MKPWLFISDLHLSPLRPEILQRFEGFCRNTAIQGERLYILGDFVEYWIGDDNPAIGLERAFDALQALSRHGVRIFFMAGNRDFLVGEQLAQRCGFDIIAEPHIIRFADTDILLMHGDTLCTDDVDYQQFRQMVRNYHWQQQFLAKPLAEREAIARNARDQSQLANTEKDEIIMDVNPQAVTESFRQHKVRYMIHGHTHRPAVHHLDVDGHDATRVVLPDWYESGGYLALSDLNQISLQTLPS